MDSQLLMQLLHSVAEGQTSVDNAADKLRHLAYEDIEFAHVDHHRSLRKGFPEVIFGQGKTAEQIIGIMDKMQHQERIILVTRIDPQKADCVGDPDTSNKRARDDPDPFCRDFRHSGCKRSLFNGQGHGEPGRNCI